MYSRIPKTDIKKKKDPRHLRHTHTFVISIQYYLADKTKEREKKEKKTKQTKQIYKQMPCDINAYLPLLW